MKTHIKICPGEHNCDSFARESLKWKLRIVYSMDSTLLIILEAFLSSSKPILVCVSRFTNTCHWDVITWGIFINSSALKINNKYWVGPFEIWIKKLLKIKCSSTQAARHHWGCSDLWETIMPLWASRLLYPLFHLLASLVEPLSTPWKGNIWQLPWSLSYAFSWKSKFQTHFLFPLTSFDFASIFNYWDEI